MQRRSKIGIDPGEFDPSACGVEEDDYLAAAELGVKKINIDTDGRLVRTRVHREYFREHPKEFDLGPAGLLNASRKVIVTSFVTSGLRNTVGENGWGSGLVSDAGYQRAFASRLPPNDRIYPGADNQMRAGRTYWVEEF